MDAGLSAKVQIMIEPNLVKRIDDWRFANRVASRSRAMRDLLVRGLDKDEKASAPNPTNE